MGGINGFGVRENPWAYTLNETLVCVCGLLWLAGVVSAWIYSIT